MNFRRLAIQLIMSGDFLGGPGRLEVPFYGVYHEQVNSYDPGRLVVPLNDGGERTIRTPSPARLECAP